MPVDKEERHPRFGMDSGRPVRCSLKFKSRHSSHRVKSAGHALSSTVILSINRSRRMTFGPRSIWRQLQGAPRLPEPSVRVLLNPLAMALVCLWAGWESCQVTPQLGAGNQAFLSGCDQGSPAQRVSVEHRADHCRSCLVLGPPFKTGY